LSLRAGTTEATPLKSQIKNHPELQIMTNSHFDLLKKPDRYTGSYALPKKDCKISLLIAIGTGKVTMGKT